MRDAFSRRTLYARVYERVRTTLSGVPSCHDMGHIDRVVANAEQILSEEVVPDLFAARLGALLHDVGRPEELQSGGKLCHASLGADKAVLLLREAGCAEEALLAHVAEIVRTHRYRGKAAPATPEAKVVYDADKLDSLGAFGIARAFHFAGRIGACLHNTRETALASEAYSREDSAYREYLVKLRFLPEKMLTETGRRIAGDRSAYMHAFFERMNLESEARLPSWDDDAIGS